MKCRGAWARVTIGKFRDICRGAWRSFDLHFSAWRWTDLISKLIVGVAKHRPWRTAAERREPVGVLLLGPLVVQRPEQQQPGGRGGVRGGVDVRDQAVAQLVGRAEELGVRVDPDPRLTVRAVDPEHLAGGKTV
jgi:hypothetical protein